MEHSNNNNFREQCGCVTQSVSTHKASMPRQLMRTPRLYVLLQVTWLPGCLFLLCSSNWADMMMPCAPWITVSNMNYFSSACLFFYMYISYLRKGWLSRDIVVTTPLFGVFLEMSKHHYFMIFDSVLHLTNLNCYRHHGTQISSFCPSKL